MRRLCSLAPVIPVLVVRDAAIAAPLAEALVGGGLPVIEVTLRTDAALDAIGAMSRVTGGIVGAGTLLSAEDVRRARDAGAAFGVSPGATDSILQAAEDVGLPMMPGAVTATEVMALRERGYDMLKFFPAETSGGAAAVRALAGPLREVEFCPTGGISPATAPQYLCLDNVRCVGGSWIVRDDLVSACDWAAIRERAAEAARLRS
ncbi:MAG: bifunctional 4-hydroxy-2-oxoglutarate aldolase/2-dehydro-3-deoxy-phosphogluconate aldolase [Alphaproteobacteria bacterium]|nr:MAG: bifunctional 4-hydroxy-2-oxoglutarate aldolase/2-dehydro-3-deoxy-phosphogluconate aldolase [Alphaproteobacteria bacterium]